MSVNASVETGIAPHLFIASSGRGQSKEVAEQLAVLLRPFSVVHPWWHDVFHPGKWTLGSLWAAVQSHDIGIFVFAEDATAEIRQKQVQIGNLNVLFEFGLFLGQLGPDRAVLLVPDDNGVHIPTDLDGLVQIRYDPDSLGDAAAAIRNHIRDVFSRASLEANDQLRDSPDRRHRTALFRSNPHVHIELRRREVLIEPDGDARHIDIFNNVRAVDSSVSRLPVQIRSSVGRPADPVYRCTSPTGTKQIIYWEWQQEHGRGPVYSGFTCFDPPLSARDVISYERTYTVHNAISWTTWDRRSASNYRRDFERLYIGSPDAVTRLELQITFPEDRFPQHFDLVVLTEHPSGREIERVAESERIRTGWKEDAEARRVELLVDLPLANHRYEIRWKLPNSDEIIPDFPARTLGFVEEANRRVLAMSALGATAYDRLRTRLLSARKRFCEALAIAPAQQEQIDCSLFLYDRRSGGLRCAGSLLRGNLQHPLMRTTFRVGQGLAGRAYRSRSPWPYRNVKGLDAVNIHTCEPLEENIPPGAILSLPLFLQNQQDRCVGVLSIDDRSGTTRLSSDISHEELHRQLNRIASEWYIDFLNEISTEASDKYWDLGRAW